MEKKLKKIFLSLILLSIALFAQLTNQPASQKLIDSGTPIVDIRTPAEWRETGVLKNAITIMFFDEQGQYDVNGFLTELNQKVDTTKPFALVCHTGSRTAMVSQFLSQELKYNVINIQGGMDYATHALHLKTFTYMK